MLGTMQFRVTILIAVLVAALAAGLTTSGVFAGDNPKERPFTASITGTFVPVEGTCGPSDANLVCDFDVHGEGNSTHMGTIIENTDLVAQIDDFFTNAASTKGSIISGSGTLTGANGDTVEISAVAGSRLDDGQVNAPFNITGGTGRFEGASGLINRIGVFSVGPDFVGEFEIRYEGTITY